MIREYEDRDVDGIIAVWHAASVIATPFLSAEFLSEEGNRIRELWMPRAETWVIESAAELEGFVAMIGDEVGGLFVHPRAQGRGFGKALLDHVATTRARLELSVFEANHIGRRFYERYGFEIIGSHLHAETGELQLRLEYLT